MTASGFLFGIVGLASSIAANELNSLHLEGEWITITITSIWEDMVSQLKELTENKS